MKLATVVVTALAAASFATGSASAVTVYDNGPSTYDFSAWTLGLGYELSNSFDLAASSKVDGFTYVTWGDGTAPAFVDWYISATPFGSALAGGSSASVTATNISVNNGIGYAIWDGAVSITPTVLGAGTYWLNLGNAFDSNGNFQYWDINNGPSYAWHNQLGDLTGGECEAYFGTPGTCSSSFTISGGPVPEPASWALMVAGFGLVGGALRRRSMTISTTVVA